MINITTIPNGIILKEQTLFFANKQLPNGYSIISETQFHIEFENGIMFLDNTAVSCNGVEYSTAQEFITAIGL